MAEKKLDDGDVIQEHIYSTFASVANSMGFSKVHGMVIAALIVADRQLSLEELSGHTGYSPSAVSLSLDLLELVGIIRKRKNIGDRKLYVELGMDLLEGLRNVFLLKIQKEIEITLQEFRGFSEITDPKTRETLRTLNREIRRLSQYIHRLSEVKLPEYDAEFSEE